MKLEMEVTNIHLINTCEVNEEEKVIIIKNWIRREGLQLIETYMNYEKEACKTAEVLSTMCEILKLQHNEAKFPL